MKKLFAVFVLVLFVSACAQTNAVRNGMCGMECCHHMMEDGKACCCKDLQGVKMIHGQKMQCPKMDPASKTRCPCCEKITQCPAMQKSRGVTTLKQSVPLVTNVSADDKGYNPEQ